MTLQSTIFWFHVPSVFGLCLFFQRHSFSTITSKLRIERELIKHTFPFHFLRYVNIVCVNITKRDPNSSSRSVLAP